jgi:hypothetical protein
MDSLRDHVPCRRRLPPALARWDFLPILIAGVVVHAWGMLDKHRVEREADLLRPWRATLLYWVCWLSLGALALVIVEYR